jgi:hypothetical protein
MAWWEVPFWRGCCWGWCTSWYGCCPPTWSPSHPAATGERPGQLGTAWQERRCCSALQQRCVCLAPRAVSALHHALCLPCTTRCVCLAPRAVSALHHAMLVLNVTRAAAVPWLDMVVVAAKAAMWSMWARQK